MGKKKPLKGAATPKGKLLLWSALVILKVMSKGDMDKIYILPYQTLKYSANSLIWGKTSLPTDSTRLNPALLPVENDRLFKYFVE